MRVLLNRRSAAAYGQDFLLGQGMEAVDLTSITLGADQRYHVDNLDSVELVVSHNPEDAVDSALIRSLPRTIPIVAHLHLQWDYLNPAQKSNLERTLDRVEVAVVPAKFMRDALRAKFPHVDWRVIHYGFDPKRFRPSPEDERASYRLHRRISNDSLVTLHVGRLEKAKGVQILQEFARLLNGDFHLWIQFLANSMRPAVTSYLELAANIERVNPSHILLIADTDPLSDRPVRYSDLLLSLSLMEVSPMVVLEAFLCGVPVLGTRASPFYDEIEKMGIDSHFCCLIDLPERITSQALSRERLELQPDEARSIARKMAEVVYQLSPPSDSDRSCLAQQAIAAGLTKDRMIEEFRTLYEEVTT